mgnify:CR=1 FL=1
MSYFYIYCNEDGETRVRETAAEGLLSELIEVQATDVLDTHRFLAPAPEDSDP